MKRTVRAESRNTAELIELEKEIRTQNEEYFKIYDEIVRKVRKEDQIQILKTNKQFIPETDLQVS